MTDRAEFKNERSDLEMEFYRTANMQYVDILYALVQKMMYENI